MSSSEKTHFSMCKESPLQTSSSNTDLSSFAASFVEHILDKIVLKSTNIQSSSELQLNTIDQSSEDSLDDKICQVSDENSSDAETENSYEEMDRCLKYDFPYVLNSGNHRHESMFRSPSFQSAPILDEDISTYNPIQNHKFSFERSKKECNSENSDKSSTQVSHQLHQNPFILLGGHLKRKQISVAPSFLRSHSESSYLHEVFYRRPNSLLKSDYIDSCTYEKDRNKFLLEVENLCRKKETDVHHRIMTEIVEASLSSDVPDSNEQNSVDNTKERQNKIEGISTFLCKELKEHYRMMKCTAATGYQIGYDTATIHSKALIDELRTKEFMLDYFRRENHRMTINELKLLLYQQQMTNRELQEKLLQSYYNPHAYDTVSQSTMRENFIRGMNRATISDYLDINAGCTVPYVSQHPEENFLDGFNIGDGSSGHHVECTVAMLAISDDSSSSSSSGGCRNSRTSEIQQRYLY
ncbi:Hypothetical predicted protein [Octopus vulgaris]|uniref:Uncharacterized protein n=1 Tax=Octopus vulgaris TaxID=6645 RepID=A0AA36B2Y4_OCTVU|nr:Hypothetical predicted protein [Octopus vulgaris]